MSDYHRAVALITLDLIRKLAAIALCCALQAIAVLVLGLESWFALRDHPREWAAWLAPLGLIGVLWSIYRDKDGLAANGWKFVPSPDPNRRPPHG